FVRFRDDKPVSEIAVRGRGTGEEGRGDSDEATRPPSLVPSPREVKFSNLDKIFWPEEGYTKGDLIEYYRAVSPWLLPYLKDRPAARRPAVHLRAGPDPRRVTGAGDRRRAPRHRDDYAPGREARGPCVSRLCPERPRAAPGRAVQCASPSGRPGVHAARLERGHAEAGHQEIHHQDRAGPDEEAR